MPLKQLLYTIVICAGACGSTGCGVIMETTHRVLIDQSTFNQPINELKSGTRNRLLACSAWREFKHENPEADYSHHFERGFKQGFVEHLELGVTEPPPLPPRKYWKVCFENAHGHEAINDWFDGFRQGVMASEEGGHRQYVTIPVSDVPKKPDSPQADSSIELEKQTVTFPAQGLSSEVVGSEFQPASFDVPASSVGEGTHAQKSVAKWRPRQK